MKKILNTTSFFSMNLWDDLIGLSVHRLCLQISATHVRQDSGDATAWRHRATRVPYVRQPRPAMPCDDADAIPRAAQCEPLLERL